MTEKDEPAIARQHWQRLLQADADAPSETTDARIRAAARRALARRPARWWLPASLAASFVLAFMLVQSQLGEAPAPQSVGESDMGEPRQRTRKAPSEDAVADAYTPPERRNQGAPAEETLDRATPASPSPAAPAPEGRAAPPAAAPKVERSTEQESATSKELRDMTVTDSRLRESKPETTAPAMGIAATAVSATRYRTPEAWYAAIEDLRADGRTGDADRELERLEAAHPGWVKEHLAELERQRNPDGG